MNNNVDCAVTMKKVMQNKLSYVVIIIQIVLILFLIIIINTLTFKVTMDNVANNADNRTTKLALACT